MSRPRIRVLADGATALGDVALLAGLSAVALAPLTTLPLLTVGSGAAVLGAALSSLRHWQKQLPDKETKPPSLGQVLKEVTKHLSPDEQLGATLEACMALACWWSFARAIKANVPNNEFKFLPTLAQQEPQPDTPPSIDLIDIRLAWEHPTIRVLRKEYESLMPWLFPADETDSRQLEADWSEFFYRELAAVLASVPLLARYSRRLDGQPGITFAGVRAACVQNLRSISTGGLPRIERQSASERIRVSLRGHLASERARVMILRGQAGVGKSTLLAREYERVGELGSRWALFARFDAVADDLARGSIDLDSAIGDSVGSGNVGLVGLAQALAQAIGPGVIFLDTLDAVLGEGSLKRLEVWLCRILDTGAVVVSTCRDVDFRTIAEPVGERLPSLASQIDTIDIPLFTTSEMDAAALSFFRGQGHTEAEALGAVQRLHEVAADRRHLSELFRVPLLLSMVCTLYPDGSIPDDLTSVRLYDSYWSEVIEGRRRKASNSERRRRARLALDIVRAMLDQEGHFSPSIHLNDLGHLPDEDLRSIAALESDGVIHIDGRGRIAFFHQTLGEYLLARHLETKAGLRVLTDVLQRPVTHTQQWLPSIRVFLARAHLQNLHPVLALLDVNSLSIYRVLAQAYVLRDDELLFDTVAGTASALGGAWFRMLTDISERALPSHSLTLAAWIRTTCVGLQHPDLLLALGFAVKVHLQDEVDENQVHELFDAIRRSVSDKPWASEALRNEKLADALGQLVAHIDALPAPLNAVWLRPLGALFQHLPDRTRVGVISIFLKHGWPPSDMAECVRSWTAYGFLRKDIDLFVSLVELTWPWLIGTASSCAWPNEWVALNDRNPWCEAISTVIGRRASTELTARMVDALAERPTELLDRANIISALSAAVDRERARTVAALLRTKDAELLDRPSVVALKPVVLRMLRTLSGDQRVALHDWTKLLNPLSDQEHLQMLAACASGDIAARHALLTVAGCRHLPMDVIREIINWAQPSDTPYISALASAVGGTTPASRQWAALVTLELKFSHSVSALRTLVQLAVRGQAEAARDAARSLQSLVDDERRDLDVNEVLKMLSCTQPSVRLAGASMAVTLVKRGVEVHRGNVTQVVERLLLEPVGNNVVSYLQLLRAMIAGGVTFVDGPLAALEHVVAGSVTDRERFHKRVVRESIALLKRVAQLEPRAETPRIEALTITLLTNHDFQYVPDAESEAVDLVQAMCRLSPAAADKLSALVPALPPRNGKAIVVGVAKIFGLQSAPLARLAHDDSLHPEVRATMTRLSEASAEGRRT